jgi:hypothetical protein
MITSGGCATAVSATFSAVRRAAHAASVREAAYSQRGEAPDCQCKNRFHSINPLCKLFFV